MKRLSLIVGNPETAKLISEFGFLSSVEFIDGSNPALLKEHRGFLSARSFSEELSALEEKETTINAALQAAASYRTDKKSLFKPYPQLCREDFDALEAALPEALETAERISALGSERAEVLSLLTALSEQAAALSPWEDFPLPLDFTGTQTCRARLCVLPGNFEPQALLGLLEEQGAYAKVISRTEDNLFLFLLYHESKTAEIGAVLTGYHASAPVLPNKHATCKDVLREMKQEKAQLEERGETLQKELRREAKACENLEYALDFIDSRKGILRCREELLYSETCAFLQGYLCERDIPKLTEALADFSVAYEITDIKEDEEPPVALYNKPLFRPFESVIALYSYPTYRSYDPTVIMAFFYFVLFGMMLADVVYGALMTTFCLLYIRIARPRKTLRMNMQLFAICGISMMLCGVLFGGFAGDFPSIFSEKMLGAGTMNLALLVDPVKDPMSFLYLSIAFGGLHLLAGMGVKFYMLCREKKVFDAICDVGLWYLVFAGIILLLLGFVDAAKWTALAGAAGLVLTQGRHEKNPIKKLFKGLLSLYDIINYASDLLSYSRVLALGLASAVIASVINTMATMFGPSVIGYICMTLILLVGHVVNILINLLGAYVHTGRLQYIEFFGKFYEDGGRAFAPFSYEPKHFDLVANRENTKNQSQKRKGVTV